MGFLGCFLGFLWCFLGFSMGFLGFLWCFCRVFWGLVLLFWWLFILGLTGLFFFLGFLSIVYGLACSTDSLLLVLWVFAFLLQTVWTFFGCFSH